MKAKSFAIAVITLVGCAVFFTLPTVAATPEVEGKQVLYKGGSVKELPENTMGAFDTTDEEKLIFNYAGGKLEFPYGRIQSYNYEEKLARRLGVIPTIAVVLVKRRQRRHILAIDFTDEEGRVQTAVFEISKEAPQTLIPILNMRCPACRPRPHQHPANPSTPPQPRPSNTSTPR